MSLHGDDDDDGDIDDGDDDVADDDFGQDIFDDIEVMIQGCAQCIALVM